MLAAGGVTQAVALDAAKRPTQYVFEHWDTANGLPVAGVKAIARTPDGFLWLGTEEGLVRFDGVEFRTFDLHQQHLGDVNALFVDRGGALWLATTGGAARWLGDRVDPTATYSTTNGLRDNRVEAMAQDASGVMWIGTAGGLHRLTNGALATITTHSGLPHDHVQALLVASDGRLWIGTNGGIARLSHGAIEPGSATTGLPHASVLALHEDASGTIWIGTFAGLARARSGVIVDEVFPLRRSRAPVNGLATDHDGSLWIGTYGEGLVRWRDGRTERFAKGDGLADDFVRGLVVDADDSLWIATDRGGLGRLKDGVITAVTTREGLPNDTVRAVVEDVNGTMWIGTHGGGLAALTGTGVSVMTTRDRLLSNVVFALGAGRRGALWIGTYNGGLNRLDAGRMESVSDAGLEKNRFVTSVFEDAADALWIGTYGGGLLRYAHGVFTTFRAADGLGSDHVWTIADDRRGGLWVGTRAGLSRWNGDRLTPMSPRDGWPSAAVWSLHVSDDGTLWAGTDEGLFRATAARTSRITTSAGLFHDVALGILEDDQGQLWMSSNKGLFRVSRRDLDELAEGRRSTITSYVYGVADGMKTAECNGSTQPSAWRSRDGRLWFATMKGVIVVDPARAALTRPRSHPFIESATVDARVLRGDGVSEPSARAGSRQFEFRYTAPSLRAAERVRYRYRLEPLESAWVEAGTRRTAYYTNLPPGHHRFRVIAAEDGGTWSTDDTATFAFFVEPRVYQTWWFRVSSALGLCAILYAGHRYRLRQVVALERVRTRIASDLHDDLGSSLSQIAILSEVARVGAGDHANVAEPLTRIATLSRESVDAMADIVWAIDPQRDLSMHLTQRLRQVAHELVSMRGMALTFDVEDEGHVELGADTKRHVFLIVKEALHNIARHSGAGEARVTGRIDSGRVRLAIDDNGRGIDARTADAKAVGGQGLRSMRQRAEALGGTLAVCAREGGGTRVSLDVPVR